MSTPKHLGDLVLPDVATAETVALFLKTTPGAVRRLFRKGEIPARKLGKRWLVSRRALLMAIEGEGSPGLRLIEGEESELTP